MVKLILADHLIADIEPHLPSNIDVVEVDSEGNLDGDASDAEVYVNGFYLKTIAQLFIDNLKRYQTGQPLRNVVDKQAGY